MSVEPGITGIARTIQLSVAPVFLLTALGTMLGVFSTRLGRIVDRARTLLDRAASATPERRAGIDAELHLLYRRRRRVNLAIAFATCAALLVCVLIAAAFVGSVLGLDFSHPIAGLFVAAMMAFIGALLAFLSEVLLAVASVRIEPR